jgi:hypothetical protein
MRDFKSVGVRGLRRHSSRLPKLTESKENDRFMTTIPNFRNLVTRSAILFAFAGLVALPTTGVAENKGGNQILALASRQSSETPRGQQPTVSTSVSCPKCKDSWASVVEKTGKAVQPEVRHEVQRHECSGCNDTTVTKGHGKAAATEAMHTCSLGEKQNTSCCVTKK